MKKLLLIIVIILLKGCTTSVDVRPIKMQAVVLDEQNTQVKDSIAYQKAKIQITFEDYEYLDKNKNNSVENVISKIYRINVISCISEQNTTVKDTINNKMSFSIGGGTYSGKLTEIETIQPEFTEFIDLYFEKAPQLGKKQYFIVEYIETDGHILKDSTQTVYLK